MDKSKELENKRKVAPANTDIFRNEESVVLTMEMPGVTKENLEIKVDGDLLIIDGKRDFEKSDEKYLVREIRPVDFHQEYTIDDTIDRNKIEATIKNGLATLTLGIRESEKPKKITVSVK